MHIRGGLASLRVRPVLAIGVLVLGVSVTISAGTWIGGVPTLIRDHLHRGAGAFSLVMIGYAVGAIVSATYLAHRSGAPEGARQPGRLDVLPPRVRVDGVGRIALGRRGRRLRGGLRPELRLVLLVSAAQEDVPDAMLGRVVGLISLVHRGAHATGLIFVAPLFAVVAPQDVFAGAAIGLALVGVAGTAAALTVSRRAV